MARRFVGLGLFVTGLMQLMLTIQVGSCVVVIAVCKFELSGEPGVEDDVYDYL